MRDMTPEHMRCAWGACPAVYELDDDTVIIIGKKPEDQMIETLRGRVGEDEYAIVVSKNLLKNISLPTSV